MQEQVISWETARMAKEKGCKYVFSDYYYDKSGKLQKCDSKFRNLHREHDVKIAALSQSLLQKWLREEHAIDVLVDYDNYAKIGYTFKINHGQYPFNKETHSHGELELAPYYSYEEALEGGLVEALKLIPMT